MTHESDRDKTDSITKYWVKKGGGGWKGSIAHNSSAPSCPGLESQHPQIFPDEKMVDVAEGYQWWCLEESRQWLENVTQPNLVLASGKLVPQKG